MLGSPRDVYLEVLSCAGGPIAKRLCPYGQLYEQLDTLCIPFLDLFIPECAFIFFCGFVGPGGPFFSSVMTKNNKALETEQLNGHSHIYIYIYI